MLFTYRGEDFGSAGKFFGSLVDCEAPSRMQLLAEAKWFFVYKELGAYWWQVTTSRTPSSGSEQRQPTRCPTCPS